MNGSRRSSSWPRAPRASTESAATEPCEGSASHRRQALVRLGIRVRNRTRIVQSFRAQARGPTPCPISNTRAPGAMSCPNQTTRLRASGPSKSLGNYCPISDADRRALEGDCRTRTGNGTLCEEAAATTRSQYCHASEEHRRLQPEPFSIAGRQGRCTPRNRRPVRRSRAGRCLSRRALRALARRRRSGSQFRWRLWRARRDRSKSQSARLRRPLSTGSPSGGMCSSSEGASVSRCITKLALRSFAQRPDH